MPEIDISSLESKLPEFSAAFSSEILALEDFRGDLTVVLKSKKIREAIRFLKGLQRCPFNVMMDLFAMDYLKSATEMPERFAVIYNLFSLQTNSRVRLKVFLAEDKPEIDSIHDLYKAANWFEREAWDLFGINFKGHPHQIRILTHHEFVGHPLRKDYPADKYQKLKTPAPSAGL